MASSITSIGPGAGVATTALALNTTVSSGTRDRAVVKEVSGGETFVATSVAFTTTQDPGGDFDVALFNGEDQETPEGDKLTMTVDEVVLPCMAVYETGDAVEVELDARDRSANIDVSVAVFGAEVSELGIRQDILSE